MADELISRQAVVAWLKKLGRFWKCCENTKHMRKTLGGIINHIEKMSAVDAVEVAHGRWIFGHTIGHAWMKCSECLKSQMPNGCFTYCPNCGARMDLEVSE